MYMQPNNESDYDLGPKEDIEQLLLTLQHLSTWTGSQIEEIPSRTLDCQLLRPYYMRVFVLMYGANTSLLLPGRLEYMAGNLAFMGRALGIRKPLGRWSYKDILLCIEKEIERVEGMEREGNLYRVDFMTRCLYVAIRDGVVVPLQEEATQLRAAVIHRMREMADNVEPKEIFVMRAGVGSTRDTGGTQDTEVTGGFGETFNVLTDDPLNSEELREFTAALYDMQLWALKHASLVPDKAVEYKLVMPYYWRLLGLMRKADSTKLLPGRLRFTAMGTSSRARVRDMQTGRGVDL